MINCPKCQNMLGCDRYLSCVDGRVVYNHTGVNINYCSGHFAIKANVVISCYLQINKNSTLIYNGSDSPRLKAGDNTIILHDMIFPQSLKEFQNNLQRIKDLLIYI